MTQIALIGAPSDSGQRRPGCSMGPAAYRVRGLSEALRALGHHISDRGDIERPPPRAATSPNRSVDQLPQTLAWSDLIAAETQAALAEGALPIILGGDHSISLGSVAGSAAQARAEGRPLFLLWLDAHSDFHTPLTSTSGNLHGTPVAFAAGLPGFESFAPFPSPLPPAQICLFGIRSVDGPEHSALLKHDMTIWDMRALDEHGISTPLSQFLERVRAEDGALHVSLDVDFLDPAIAPAVGTTVPGGATFREAHLVMELLHESQRITALDLVELNPMLDERGRTTELMIDLTCSALGKKVFDRPTRLYP